MSELIDFLYEVRANEDYDYEQDKIDKIILSLEELEQENQRLIDDKAHLLNVIETMIPLTVCSPELKKQWQKLLTQNKEV